MGSQNGNLALDFWILPELQLGDWIPIQHKASDWSHCLGGTGGANRTATQQMSNGHGMHSQQVAPGYCLQRQPRDWVSHKASDRRHLFCWATPADRNNSRASLQHDMQG